MACDIDIFDAAQVSPTSPDDDDLLMFFLPDKSVVFRTWANVKTALVPDDINWIIADGADPLVLNSGESAITLSDFAGFRVRLLRNGINQVPFAVPDSTYYLYNIATGHFDVVPAVQRDEIIQIQSY